jgi:hypothetical protein
MVYELTKCIGYCKDIRVNRRIGNTHENLDRLQSSLEAAGTNIARAYEGARSLNSSGIDLGDGA